MLKLLKFLLLLAVGLFGAGLAAINPATVSLSYYFGAFELPLGVLCLLLLGVGMVIGAAGGLWPLLRARHENGALLRQARRSSGAGLPSPPAIK